MSDNKYIYDAFISYRHSELDKFVVDNLHKMLESYKAPKNIKNLKKSKINRVFRDRDELPTSSDLATSIKNALESSEYLIVVCSPRLPQSKWCLEEIKTFSKLHGHDKILAILIEGEPSESFPEELITRRVKEMDDNGNEVEKIIEVEPLAADIRGKDKKEILKLLKAEKLRLLAPILGCKYDDLKQRHRERRIRKIIALSAIVASVVLSFGTISTYQAIKLKRQVDETLVGQSRYLSDMASKNLEDGDRRTAVLLALEALPKDKSLKDRPYVGEAEFALSKALGSYKVSDSLMGDMALKHEKNVVGFDSLKEKLLTITEDGDLYVWKDEKFQKNTIIHRGSSITERKAFFSEDGSKIVGTTDEGIAAWDSSSCKKLWGKKDSIYRMGISEKRSKLAYVGDSISVVDVDTGKLIYKYELEDKNSCITSLVFSKDEKYLAVGSLEGKLILLDEKGTVVLKKDTAYKGVEELCFNNDGSKLMIASNDIVTLGKDKKLTDEEKEKLDKANYDIIKGNIQLISTSTGEVQKSYSSDTASIRNISFGKKDENKIIFSEDKNCKVYNIEAGKLLNTLPSGGKVNYIDVIDEESLIVTAADDGTVRFFQMKYGKEADQSRINTDYSISKIKSGNGRILLLPRKSNNLYVWKVVKDDNITEIAKVDSLSYKGSVTKDNKNIIILGNEGISVFDKRSKALKFKIDKSNYEIKDYKELGDKLIVKTKDSICTFDINSGKEIEKFKFSVYDNVNFTEDGSKFVLVNKDNVLVGDCSTLKEINKIAVKSGVTDVIISEDNSKVVLKSYDKKINILDLKNLKPITKSEITVKNICAISNNGELLAFDKDDEIDIYDIKADKVIGSIKNINFKVNKLIFSKDNKSIIAYLDNKDIKIFDVKKGELNKLITGVSFVDDIKFTDKYMFVLNQGIATKYNTDDYTATANIVGFMGVSKDGKEILINSNRKIAVANNYSLEELLKNAKKVVGEYDLSNEEKRKYYIVK